MNPEIQQKIERHFYHMGLRMTKPRQKLIECVFSSDEHFTADELLERAKKMDPKTARATVYRTLAMLTEAGVVGEIDLGKGQRVYDPNFADNPNHNHLICVDCGKVVEFEDEHMAVLEDCLTRRMGFRPSKKSLRIEACCDQLRKEGFCPNLVQARLEKKV